ncbi:cupin domain-containing protein [Pigmentibacter ruber]|uniref:cupin domain-containing protein n=1 Tax=Pigmentibacter ruber TaxID=2683196 RepID=UPI00131B6882|nr:cupin domain-containing protein [Pigmentibacter ruber]
MFDLETLLSPITLENFFKEFWTTKGLVLRAQNPDRFRSLFSWDDLNYLLNFHKLRFRDDIRFAAQGKKRLLDVPDTPSDWIKHCQEGYTMIISQLHARLPIIASLASKIEQEIGHRTQVNMYCSWPNQQGFDSHHDDHEVFILQIEGTKKWYVSKGTYPYPLDKYGRHSVDTGEPEGAPYIETVLNRGDILYIPRGHWHHAVACHEPSLHLTVGITCRTGLFWLKWLADELINDPQWRKNLPPVIHGDKKELASYIRNLFKQLATLSTDEQLVQAYLTNHQVSQSSRNREVSLPSQSGFYSSIEKQNTKLRRPKYQAVQIEYDSQLGQHRITDGSKKISLEGVPAKLIENLFSSEFFTLAEAASWAPHLDIDNEIAPLLRRLVEEGIFVECSNL